MSNQTITDFILLPELRYEKWKFWGFEIGLTFELPPKTYGVSHLIRFHIQLCNHTFYLILRMRKQSFGQLPKETR